MDSKSDSNTVDYTVEYTIHYSDTFLEFDCNTVTDSQQDRYCITFGYTEPLWYTFADS